MTAEDAAMVRSVVVGRWKTGLMTTASKETTGTRRALAFLAAVVAAVTAILLGTVSSAPAAATAETRVGASELAARVLVEPQERIGAGQRLGQAADRAELVVATGVAACSFSGATLVLMADGSKKPIDQIEVGDQVIATDPDTGEQAAETVTHLWIHNDTLIDLVVDGEVITTTEDHPFWSATDQKFERADELAPGEKVLGADVQLIRVTGLKLGTGYRGVAYNLTVAGIHTYHVGGNAILVHNTGTCINWAANSVKTFGHTFNTHGAGSKNAGRLLGRARGTGNPQGQWLDSDAAAQFLSGAHIPGAGPYSVTLPEGLGQVIMPDGSIVVARAATIIPNSNGVIRTAYPTIGGP